MGSNLRRVPPSPVEVRKVLERETLGLDFGFIVQLSFLMAGVSEWGGLSSFSRQPEVRALFRDEGKTLNGDPCTTS